MNTIKQHYLWQWAWTIKAWVIIIFWLQGGISGFSNNQSEPRINNNWPIAGLDTVDFDSIWHPFLVLYTALSEQLSLAPTHCSVSGYKCWQFGIEGFTSISHLPSHLEIQWPICQMSSSTQLALHHGTGGRQHQHM